MEPGRGVVFFLFFSTLFTTVFTHMLLMERIPKLDPKLDARDTSAGLRPENKVFGLKTISVTLL
jgi:hypothetical protein